MPRPAIGRYKVVKTINGHRYLYWQRTKRVGKAVKTENRYIGPAAGSPSSTPSTVSPSTYSTTAPRTPEDAKKYFTPTQKPVTSAETADAMDKILQRRQEILAKY